MIRLANFYKSFIYIDIILYRSLFCMLFLLFLCNKTHLCVDLILEQINLYYYYISIDKLFEFNPTAICEKCNFDTKDTIYYILTECPYQYLQVEIMSVWLATSFLFEFINAICRYRSLQNSRTFENMLSSWFFYLFVVLRFNKLIHFILATIFIFFLFLI